MNPIADELFYLKRIKVSTFQVWEVYLIEIINLQTKFCMRLELVDALRLFWNLN